MPPSLAGPSRRITRRRQGVSAVIAMLYMVLFGTLAVGFYATTTISAQVGHNESRMFATRTAAESGMEFMRYHLSMVQIPPLMPDDMLMDAVHKYLSDTLELTGNLGPTNYVDMNAGKTQIDVPAGNHNYISLYANGPSFRATIKRQGRDLVVTTIGNSGKLTTGRGLRSGVELTFRPTQERGSFFSHGMAAKGGVSITTSGGVIQGTPPEYANLYALGPVTIGPGTSTTTVGIAGELYVPAGTTPTIGAYTSVDGQTVPAKVLDPANDHLNYVTAAQRHEYPTPDTSIFRPYATNTYVAGKTYYENVLIPPSTNPEFNGPCTIMGVVYVRQPNVVKFAGQVTMQCVVATEDINVGTMATNALQFTGTGGAKLPVSDLPPYPQFDGIRDLTGAFIVAPGFDVIVTGNFGTVIGDICGDRVSIGGSSSVDISGSIFTLEPAFPLTISGNAKVSLAPSPNSLHSGIRHTEAILADPSTWREIILD